MHSYISGPDTVTGPSAGESHATSHLLFSFYSIFLDAIMLGFSSMQKKPAAP